MKESLNKLNKKTTFSLKREKILHVPLSEIFSCTYNPSVNIIYDNVKIKTGNMMINRSRKVNLLSNAYSKRIEVFTTNKNNYAYIDLLKVISPNMYIYIYILCMILFIILVCIIYSNTDKFFIDESNNLIVCNVDLVNTSNKRCTEFSLNNINKSIPNLNDLNTNKTKLNFIQCNQWNTKNKFEDSVILNKVKDLYFKEIITECNKYKSKILELEIQINNYKEANYNLAKDIKDIIRELEFGRKNS